MLTGIVKAASCPVEKVTGLGVSDVDVGHAGPVAGDDGLDRIRGSDAVEDMQGRLVAVTAVAEPDVPEVGHAEPRVAVRVVRDVRQKWPGVIVVAPARPVHDDQVRVPDHLR